MDVEYVLVMCTVFPFKSGYLLTLGLPWLMNHLITVKIYSLCHIFDELKQVTTRDLFFLISSNSYFHHFMTLNWFLLTVTHL